MKLERVDFKAKSGSLALNENWYQVDCPIKYLVLSRSELHSIQNNAFHAKQFTELESLRIYNVPIKTLKSGAFNGLSKLQALHMQLLNLLIIEMYILAPVPNLKLFSLQLCGQYELKVDSFFGDVDMMHLKHVKITNCKLADGITKSTFTGLRKIKTLELKSNEITQIGPKSFDAALETLTFLDLSLNKLQTLPQNLFKTNQENDLSIDLKWNPWHCDCELEHFRVLLEKSPNIKLKYVVKCDTPYEHSGKDLMMISSLCEPELSEEADANRTLETNTAPDKEVNTTPDKPNKVPNPNEHPDKRPNLDTLHVTCEDDFGKILEILKFHTPASENLPLVYFEDERVFVNADHLPPVFELVEFVDVPNDNATLLQCLANKVGNDRKVDLASKLGTNRMYRYCLVESGSNVISDCVAIFLHAKNVERDSWKWIKDLILMIVSLFTSSVLGLLIGIVISMGITKKFPSLIGVVE